MSCVQFGRISKGIIDGTLRGLFSQLPTNPRLALGTFQGDPESAWAVTAIASNWNTSTTANEGPQYIMDNATMWAAPSFVVALPLIQRAHTSTDPLAVCLDLPAGGRCAAPEVVAQYQEPRDSTAIFGPQFTPEDTSSGDSDGDAAAALGANATQTLDLPARSGGSNDNSTAWVVPVVVVLVVVAVMSAPSAAPSFSAQSSNLCMQSRP